MGKKNALKSAMTAMKILTVVLHFILKIIRPLEIGTFKQKERQPTWYQNRLSYLVRVTGLEPASLSTPDPKSGVFANFTIPAYM